MESQEPESPEPIYIPYRDGKLFERPAGNQLTVVLPSPAPYWLGDQRFAGSVLITMAMHLLLLARRRRFYKTAVTLGRGLMAGVVDLQFYASLDEANRAAETMEAAIPLGTYDPAPRIPFRERRARAKEFRAQITGS